jgi:RNA polymerase sigma-70 factor (ECF subfamily)
VGQFFNSARIFKKYVSLFYPVSSFIIDLIGKAMLDGDKEKKLVERSRIADCGAYAELVRAYSKKTFAICLAIVGDRHDAEDITQQALLRGFTEITGLRDPRRFGLWIAQIARNLSIDFLRGKTASANARANLPGPLISEHNDHPELRIALAKLPQKYRMPLMLYYFDGRSADSVARVLGISEQAIYTRLSRARKMLRKILESQGDLL